MTKAKYNFHELMKSETALPDDVNQMCIDTINRLDTTGKVTAFFKKQQDKKLFGTLNVMSQVAPIRLLASFEMHRGVVKMFKLISYAEDNNPFVHFMRTVKNNSVSFKRGEHDEDV